MRAVIQSAPRSTDMRLVLSAAIAAALAVSSSGAPAAQMLTVQKFAGPTKNSSFIVALKAGVSMAAHLQQNPDIAAAVTHPDFAAGLLNGFAGTFSAAQVDAPCMLALETQVSL